MITEEKKVIKNWNYKQSLYSKTSWNRYYAEYTLAIENLLERSDQSNTTVLALPILFLMRHSLELAFKTNLLELEEISMQKANIKYSTKSAHILSDLHAEFEKQVDLIFKKENISKEVRRAFVAMNMELKGFRKLFDELDNWSYSFRYPVMSDGKTKSFKKSDMINISDIIPIYIKTQIVLKYTTNVLLDPASKN